jgi:hypothetical protein
MKNLFLVIILVIIGKVSTADNCNIQFSFTGKSNTWKPVDYTLSNGIIYLDIDASFDSLNFKILKNESCASSFGISSCIMNDQPQSELMNGNEIKTSATGGLYKILILGPNTSDWYKIFVRINKSTSVKNTFQNTHFNIFPNPATNNVNIENTTKVQMVKIFDITGALVVTMNNYFKRDNLDIDISNLPAGQYFITFYNDQEKVTKKLMKQ